MYVFALDTTDWRCINIAPFDGFQPTRPRGVRRRDIDLTQAPFTAGCSNTMHHIDIFEEGIACTLPCPLHDAKYSSSCWLAVVA